MPVVRPQLLDLFCGAGGATKGYQQAGFHVVGVDIKPQPNYCGDDFIELDALSVLREDVQRREGWGKYFYPVEQFDAIHASPPCQTNVKGLAAVNALLGRVSKHVDLIAETRHALRLTGLPYVIENVEGAAMLAPVRLCGSSFALPVRRHRLFESNVLLMVPDCEHDRHREKKYWTSWRPNGEVRLAGAMQVYGNAGERHLWGPAMGIDWMTPDELAQAIPPAYTEHIGKQLIQHVQKAVA